MAIIINTHDKAKIEQIIRERHLTFVDSINEPYENTIRVYYKDPQGEIYVLEEKPKPMKLQYVNTNTQKYAIQSFIKMFAELVLKVSKNAPDKDIDLSITRTQTPIQKFKKLTKKDYPDDAELEKVSETVIIGTITKILSAYKEQRGVNVCQTIEKILSMPQMSTNPDNATMKISLDNLYTIASEKEKTSATDIVEEKENDEESEAE